MNPPSKQPEPSTRPARVQRPLQALKGVRILSLCLNLPGPAAVMRCTAMGATCVKLEPPPPKGANAGTPGDPMGLYNRSAYDVLHAGVKVAQANLKTPEGQARLHRELAKADVLLTSFRPSALKTLGLNWPQLHRQYPALSQVAIVGARGDRAEEPGHDLTYLAEHGLVTGTELPATLYADMGGSRGAVDAVQAAVLLQRRLGKGTFQEVALADAAAYLALPRTWGLTRPGAAVGGGHAGYRVYACADGRVAVAALEPHFAQALCSACGMGSVNIMTMFAPATHAAIAGFFATRSCAKLQELAQEKDIPMHTLPGTA